MTGKFITVEGGEGAGKTSNLNFIKSLLEASGKSVVFTREPGGTGLGEDIRELLLGHKHTGMSDLAELLLVFAARAEHLEQVIKPALNNGQWVLCDRFTDATYAYQGGGRSLDMESIKTLESLVQDELRPDLTLLLDLPVEQGMQRAGQRSAPDRFEKEKMDFFDKVRATYLQRAEADPDRIKTIDAGKTLEQVQAQISQVIDHFMLGH